MDERRDVSENQLLLGIDLGTSRTAVMSNKGYKAITRSVVGYPKDIIGIKLLGDTQVFGEEAMERRSALTLYHPLEDGVIRETSDQDYNAAFELVKHVVEQARQGSKEELCGIIGVPARASVMNKELLLGIARELMPVALVVSEPFMVAYYLNKLSNCVVVDIGAGTVDICGMKGTIPSQDDQATILKGGSFIDERLETAISQRYPHAQVTRNLVRKLKEEYAFVGEPEGPVTVTLRSDGKPGKYDITEEMRTVCESIVPDIVEHLIATITGYDPEDQPLALQNIYLAGGGSRIRNIDSMIEKYLHDYGDVKVTCVDDPDYIGSAGALKMATDLPPKYWGKVGFYHS